MLDTTFFNTLSEEKERDAFFLLQRRMFEAAAEVQKVKDEAEVTRVAEVKAETKKAKTKAEKLAEDREVFFAKYGKEFTTESLTWAGKVKKAAQAVNLRFSSYVDNEVDKDGKFIRTVLKCVISIPKK